MRRPYSPEYRYTFEIVATDDGQYRATEPDADTDSWGRGETPAAAIKRYCELVDGGGEGDD